MRDTIVKGIVFGGKARVTVIDITGIVNELISIHNLGPLAAAALGRSMTAGAYISTNLKSSRDTFSLSINGQGPLEGVTVAGEGGNFIRGYAGNPNIELPLKENGHLDVSGAVGTDGFITVIKSMGLKEPYTGRCGLVSGEIAEDFASYLYLSEGVRAGVALGVKVDSSGCVGAGGVIVEALPDFTDGNKLYMLEDVMSNFANVSEVLEKSSPEEIFEFYFSHLDALRLPEEKVYLRCNCSYSRIENMVRALGKEEAEDILTELGKIEAVCHFCNKKYVLEREDVAVLWEK